MGDPSILNFVLFRVLIDCTKVQNYKINKNIYTNNKEGVTENEYTRKQYYVLHMKLKKCTKVIEWQNKDNTYENEA